MFRFASLFSLFFAQNCVSQGDIQSSSAAISDCTGSVNIFQPGSYSLQFTGKQGKIKDLEQYPSLKEVSEANSVWCSFKSPSDGRFTLSADIPEGTVQMIIFENETKDVCDDILRGKAEIRRLVLVKTKHAGLDLVTSDNVLYPIDLKAGRHLMICFVTEAKMKSKVALTVNFEPMDGSIRANGDHLKVVDLRKSKSEPALNIQVRDAETGNPVSANMSLQGLKGLSALYIGSDFFIQIDKSGKIKLKFDAEGYFFVDREEPVSAGTDNELVIWMEPLGEGKSMQIDEVEFYPGSSELLPTAETKLRRIRDFLALNANIRVEIGGHVHDNSGENSFAAQKISEARAKRVMKYLVDNGISKSRLTAVGYGNTKPIYKDAKFAYEEQANRRVEIKIL